MKKQNNAIIGIYKILSPTNKIYIGQSINIYKRWKLHKGVYISHTFSKLKRSFQKYGVENHTFEIIEECTSEQLNEREIYWIQYHNSIEEGLNISLGGEGGKMNDETKQKISKAKIGHICYSNIERNNKISKSLTGIKKHNVKKGKEKLGKKQELDFKIHLIKLHSKAIMQFDKHDKFIREYSSILEASEFTSIHRENIGSVLRKKSKTAGGYIWKFK